MKSVEYCVYLTSNQPIVDQVWRPLLTEVLALKIKLHHLSTTQVYFFITQPNLVAMQTFLTTYLQENQQRLHMLLTYRHHALGSLLGQIGLKKNPGKAEDITDLILQLSLEHDWRFYPVLQQEFSLIPRHLVLTAMAFLTTNMNASQASQKLYIHRNTFTYRLQKFIQLTSLDIREFRHAVFFNLVQNILVLKR